MKQENTSQSMMPVASFLSRSEMDDENWNKKNEVKNKWG